MTNSDVKHSLTYLRGRSSEIVAAAENAGWAPIEAVRWMHGSIIDLCEHVEKLESQQEDE